MTRFEISFLTDHTDDSLLNEIRRVASLHSGSSLSTEQFKQLSGRVSVDTIRRRLGGSWKTALMRAGLGHLYGGRAISTKMKVQAGKRLSNKELIVEMQRVLAAVGGNILTMPLFDAHSTVSSGTVSRRFGGWAKALKQAGIEQSEMANKNWTNEECFENLASVWTHHAKQPSIRQMFSSPSVITGDAYITRWGTWRKALRAFVTWANSELGGRSESQQPKPEPRIQNKTVKPTVVRQVEENQRQVPLKLRFIVFRRDRFRCIYCGRSPATDLDTVLHADHVRPVADNGLTVLENLQTLCERCNLGKGKLPG